VVAGALLWVGVGLRLRRQLVTSDDRVLDPRTGADMAPEIPWWARAVIVSVPLTGLVLCLVLGLVER
jgi:hypothetical protein